MIELAGRRIALIGGAGFIGHHLALRLKELGAEVHILDSLQINNLLAFTSSGDNIPNRDLYLSLINERLDLLRAASVPLHVLDARDYQVLGRVIANIDPQVVVHLAAVSHAQRANKDPYSTFDHSSRTLENALDASRDRVEQFVFFSSSMVYGDFDTSEVTEDTVCNPLGIYGALKYGGEKLVIAYNQVFDLPYTIVRPSALYGERCVSRRVGQVFIENAVTNLGITVDGDGTDRLDFTYIADLVHGLEQVLTHERAINEIFNLTYGASRSIADLVDILRPHFPDVEIERRSRDKLMPSRGTLSVEKATSLIGYEPSWPLERGLVQYVEWYKQLSDRGHFAAASP